MLNEVLESCEKWPLLINPLTVPVLPHTEISRLICCANKLTGFHIYEGNAGSNRLKANVKQNETKEMVVPIVVHSYIAT